MTETPKQILSRIENRPIEECTFCKKETTSYALDESGMVMCQDCIDNLLDFKDNKLQFKETLGWHV